MRFRLLLRAAAITAMLVTMATRASTATSPSIYPGAPRAAVDLATAMAQQPLRFVSIRRPPPLAACAQLEARGPIIDAIQIRRGGVVISEGVGPYLSSARCTADGLTGRAPSCLGGPPDGVGVRLGGNELGWSVAEGEALREGDEVVVTVIGGMNEPYQVFAGADRIDHRHELGTLTGSATVPVPAR
jgi:hypothetical protein